jgi:hypothetical protein
MTNQARRAELSAAPLYSAPVHNHGQASPSRTNPAASGFAAIYDAIAACSSALRTRWS